MGQMVGLHLDIVAIGGRLVCWCGCKGMLERVLDGNNEWWGIM